MLKIADIKKERVTYGLYVAKCNLSKFKIHKRHGEWKVYRVAGCKQDIFLFSENTLKEALLTIQQTETIKGALQ